MSTFPYKAKALLVRQALAPFYVAVLPAELLLEICFSDRLKATKVNSGYELSGNQRAIDADRLKVIGSYISRTDAAFPNSIILAANYRAEDGFAEDDEEIRWSVITADDVSTITIPSAARLAAIIDGQHRLFGFTKTTPDRLSMPLVCSIYFELPKPFQAQLFATINSTQKRVDKSLTYELFGYNISEETAPYWSPDKLAVFLARKLNSERGSPFQDRIIVAPENDFSLAGQSKESWKISMAAVVDGLIRLISNNPTRDADALLLPNPKDRSTLDSLTGKDTSPFRKLYVGINDELLFGIVRNFFIACSEIFWNHAKVGSYITKTTGIQALFDVLGKVGPMLLENKDLRVETIVKLLTPASALDFSEPVFASPSGKGRTAIRNAILETIDAIPIPAQRAN